MDAYAAEPENLALKAKAEKYAEIIVDNCQDVIFGGFAPNSQTAPEMSKALGSYTAMSGSVSRGKNDSSQSLQMIERPLLTADELKTLPKGEFVVMKTGARPMRTRLRLFLDWGITFGEPYIMPERASRKVAYAGKDELERAIFKRHYAAPLESAEYAEIASKLRSSLRV
jgi:type IV secretion system protein VirD4